MHASILLASVAAVAVLAAPSYPVLSASSATPDALDTAAKYFNLLAEIVQESQTDAPVCNISAAELPTTSISPALPPPSSGLVVKHVAIGRGTQNYTCATSDTSTTPAAVGAVATLFNASCIAASYPDLLALLPAISLNFNLTNNSLDAYSTRLYPSNLNVSGHHYFTTTSTPFFDIDSPELTLGQVHCAKNNTQNAPSTAATSTASATSSTTSVSNLGQQGEAAVAWLKLVVKDEGSATGGLREVYRVETAGGSAPATCDGMASSFEVQYAAQYWFYESA